MAGFLSEQKKPPGWAACTSLAGVFLLHSHLGHPNRKLVLKNKDRNNNDKDEAGEKSLHDLSWVSPDYRPFRG